MAGIFNGHESRQSIILTQILNKILTVSMCVLCMSSGKSQAASPPTPCSLNEVSAPSMTKPGSRYTNIIELAEGVPVLPPNETCCEEMEPGGAFVRSIKPVPWPEWIEDRKYPRAPAQPQSDEIWITHINQATILIQVDGLNILTDPIWSTRASPFSWVGPKRVRNPGLRLEELPRIDLILISHNHYDHLDLPSLQQLNRDHSPAFLTGTGNGETLEEMPNVQELGWWQSCDFGKLKIRFLPAQHSSARGMFDRNKTLWGGFMIESSHGNIYFAGDTGYGAFATHIKKMYPKIFIGLLPIGHYLPREMMKDVHLSPYDATLLHQYLNIRYSIGMHYGTFHGLGAHNAEGVDQHAIDLTAALAKSGVAETDFLLLGFGEAKKFTSTDTSTSKISETKDPQ